MIPWVRKWLGLREGASRCLVFHFPALYASPLAPRPLLVGELAPEGETGEQEGKETQRRKREGKEQRKEGRKGSREGGRMDWPVRRVVLPWQAMLKKGERVPSDFLAKHRGWNVS